MTLTIQFLGAAGTVTGSKYLLDNGSQKVLVDCGLFQGLKELRLQNWEKFPISPAEIDAVVLTHSHLDHSGFIPLLVKQGFKGPVFATPPTCDLSKILLLDSAHIQEEDAQHANEKGFSKHSPAKPLYTTSDVYLALELLRPTPDKEWIEILPGWKMRFQKSGHILGSAFIELLVGGVKTVFSGDLGRQLPLTLDPPLAIEDADYLLIESTYGDRLHPTAPVLEQLSKVIVETVEKGGHLLIPSFAVGRTQDLLYLLSVLKRNSSMPEIPVFLDSPLGLIATEIFENYSGWHKLSREDIGAMQEITTIIKSRQQSQEVMRRRPSSIVIAGSGMVSGGRILHHLCARLWDKRNTVLLVGYQAAGTRGRQLQQGVSEIKMHGEYFAVGAEVVELSGLSAHADQNEILTWLGHFKTPPKETFIVHGEPQASDALRVRIQDTYRWKCQIPKAFEKQSLSPRG